MVKWTRAGLVMALAVILTFVVAACGDKKADSKDQASGASSQTTEGAAASDASSKPSGEKVKVNIAINGGLSPLIIAQAKGFYEEAFSKLNAEISWSKFPSGPPLLESLVAGRVDLSFLGDGATIAGISNKLPFEVIGLNSEGKSGARLLVPPTSSIQKLEDVKGKTIGLPKGTVANVYLIKVLAAAGLSISDVNIINLQMEDAQAAFESGKLDGWVAWDPYITQNVNTGKARVIETDTEVLSPTSLIAHTKFAEEHPELVVEFLKVYKQTVDYELAHEDEAAQIFSEQTKLPVDTVKQVLANSSPILSTYTQAALDAQQASSDILYENKFIKNQITFKDAVNDTFVTEALK
ncbi:sulfonate transport system substrate-binding protein [Paenibacillus cellulosilyticus]|uniref:Putative aliphatic sulfonates-binding protein n=1 Tax=Paenibacillus cellulosilyticus TaxID=375489 RepID=A0A2V2YMV4_9BACL|nr:aliphatic sulfonate ABC transporter substrate-binding protein [Paenibacillus cellulosilyticus]PWV95713.1 sulfonate transport system substrate-binding protein [Paenibacillus cellulosilyticus]QKS47653.1 aliphatic sulfonate ABC transporter substrate-binding protein [Paenibacillus cellulosilyticus]